MAASEGSKRTARIAVLYELWTLDVVSDLGVVCGSVFAAHAEQFKNVGRETADVISQLRYRTGADEEHLDADQRSSLCTQLLGACDGTRHDDTQSAFQQAAGGVRQAAVDFVQRSFDTGEQQLRNAFRDAATSFNAYLTGIEGAVPDSAARRIGAHFEQVVGVLRDPQFSGGLGLPPAPNAPWPRYGDLGGDGAVLVETLDAIGSSSGLTTRDPVDRAGFIAVQRVADQGAATIDLVIADPAFAKDAAADAAINSAYRWWTAIRDFRSAG